MSQRFLDCFAPKMKALRRFETSLTSKPHSAPSDIPAYLNLQQDRCENLKSRSVFFSLPPSDDVVLNAIELQPPVGLLHHSQRIGMEHWWNDNWRMKIEVKSSKSQKKLPHLPLFPQQFCYGLFWERRRVSAMKLHAWITVLYHGKKRQQFLINVYCLECDRATRCEWRQHKVHL